MLRRLWCNLFHKKTWDCMDSQCYPIGSTELVQLILNHCPKCDLYVPAVFRIKEVGAKTERLV